MYVLVGDLGHQPGPTGSHKPRQSGSRLPRCEEFPRSGSRASPESRPRYVLVGDLGRQFGRDGSHER
jgi:hypothetical protein